MNIKNLHSVYFLGAGGIGMSALARYLLFNRIKISGYDKTKTALTIQLQKEGMDIHYLDDIDQIPNDIDLAVYTPAIPQNLNEFQFLRESAIPMMKRAELLEILTEDKNTIAVSGTHGKTTVSCMISHILDNSGVGCTAFLGGILKNNDSNLIHSEKADWLVTEADEYDRSFLKLHPQIGLITSIDADHLDIYENYDNLLSSFSQFIKLIAEKGILIKKETVDIDVSKTEKEIQIFNYSLTSESSDFYAQNIELQEGHYYFDIVTPTSIIKNVKLGVQGLINVENAIAATAAATLAGADMDEVRSAMSTFLGIKRRFDYQIKEKELIFIDDYAHHPEEIKGFVKSVKEMHPGKKILGIFQPHLYSRTRDFKNDFAISLELLDDIILLPIYPARELPIEGVNSEMILNRIKKNAKQICSKENLIEVIKSKEFDILLTMGAGDIDQLVGQIKDSIKSLKSSV